MAEREGVIKYRLDYRREAVLAATDVAEMEAWRQVCRRLQWIGQWPPRYQGLGFGNISQRWPCDAAGAFVISGTQTGGRAVLSAADYVWVPHCDPYENTVAAVGMCQPSSEAMTHAQVYHLLPRVNAVIHAHCPHIWRHAQALKMPMTAADVPYGTRQMAQAVAALLAQAAVVDLGGFAMAGHEDGVVAFGESFFAASSVLLGYLAQALRLDAVAAS